MKRIFSSILALGFVFAATALNLPEKTDKMVNDFAGVFSYQQVYDMEQRLEAFSDSTSNQICIVTIADLEDLESSDYAQRLGEKWGVGSSNKKAKDNGVIILIKPRNEYGGGDVAIATGYGIEGVLPDATCKMLIEKVMIPELKEGRYYEAVEAAVMRIMPIMQGEYDFSKDELQQSAQKQSSGNQSYFWVIVLLGVGIWLIIRFAGRKKRALMSGIENAKSPEELEKAIAAAREGKVKDSKIDSAKAKVPENMFNSLRNAASPAAFATLAAAATAMGLGADRIANLEGNMRENTLSDLRSSSSREEVLENTSRARAFGNDEAAIKAAAAAALAAIAAAAIAAAAAARRSNSSSSSSSSSSSAGFGGFGGGHFGGGGASGKF